MAQHKHVKEMFDKRFLIAEAFEPGVDKIFTIKDVLEEKIENPANGTSDVRPVLYFEETDLQLGLNKANTDTLIKLFKTGFVDQWVGQKIQLFSTTTKAFGETVQCIRIRPFKPELKCSVCGKEIDDPTYFGSIEKYGKPLCSKECLDRDRNGEQIL